MVGEEQLPQVKVMNHLAAILQSVVKYLMVSLTPTLSICSSNHVRQSLKSLHNPGIIAGFLRNPNLQIWITDPVQVSMLFLTLASLIQLRHT